MSIKPSKSNLDMTGSKLVKRGSLVSWHGSRFFVSSVRLGVLYPDASANLNTQFFWCSEVQVVGQRVVRSSSVYKKAMFDLRLLVEQRVAQRQGPACGMGPLRGAHPVGNTGITINLPNPIES